MNGDETVPGWIPRLRSLLRGGFLRRPRLPVVLTVGPSDVFLRSPAGRRPVILVTHGAAWVTQAGDPVDYCVAAGESVRLSGRGSIAVQALGNQSCRVELSDL